MSLPEFMTLLGGLAFAGLALSVFAVLGRAFWMSRRTGRSGRSSSPPGAAWPVSTATGMASRPDNPFPLQEDCDDAETKVSGRLFLECNAAEGRFLIETQGQQVECIVPLETLIDRFPACSLRDEDNLRLHEAALRSVAQILARQGCGREGRMVIRGIDFLGRM